MFSNNSTTLWSLFSFFIAPALYLFCWFTFSSVFAPYLLTFIQFYFIWVWVIRIKTTQIEYRTQCAVKLWFWSKDSERLLNLIHAQINSQYETRCSANRLNSNNMDVALINNETNRVAEWLNSTTKLKNFNTKLILYSSINRVQSKSFE